MKCSGTRNHDRSLKVNYVICAAISFLYYIYISRKNLDEYGNMNRRRMVGGN